MLFYAVVMLFCAVFTLFRAVFVLNMMDLQTKLKMNDEEVRGKMLSAVYIHAGA